MLGAHCSGGSIAEGLLKWDETFLDGCFAPAKKGALPSVKPSAARAQSGWYWSMVKVFRWEFGSKVPLRVKLSLRKPRSPKSASPAQRPSETEAETYNRRPGLRSDPLRERLKKRGIELIVPYRKNNKATTIQDGRKLRRYMRRWIVERTNAWLGQFRRLLVRHEHLLSTYQAFFYLACFWITLRRYF